VTSAKLVGVAIGPEEIEPVGIDVDGMTFGLGQMDGDQLTGHGTAILHACETDVTVTNLEALREVPDHLGM
tara:strand:- start:966 stop:1178 length:213 start_codon:yes stop_codon:yes gene_type:complete